MRKKDYNIDMKLSNKLTDHEELRLELLHLVDRINLKIRKITTTHQKLPYDRLRIGRALKQLALDAIECIDQGKEIQLRECIQQLGAMGLLKLWG